MVDGPVYPSSFPRRDRRRRTDAVKPEWRFSPTSATGAFTCMLSLRKLLDGAPGLSEVSRDGAGLDVDGRGVAGGEARGCGESLEPTVDLAWQLTGLRGAAAGAVASRRAVSAAAKPWTRSQSASRAPSGFVSLCGKRTLSWSGCAVVGFLLATGFLTGKREPDPTSSCRSGGRCDQTRGARDSRPNVVRKRLIQVLNISTSC